MATFWKPLASLTTEINRGLRFCVVGSGPSGFYTADRLLKRFGASVEVDVIDRLPTPFGLVRSGVAPDHADTKNVVNSFSSTAEDTRCRFVGNVTVGRDVQLTELRNLYHGVVLAYGAESDRRLGIPGEAAKGVFSAREFVWWYNGHPDSKRLPVDLARVKSVAICGIGNVALDCARVLLKPPDALAITDMAQHALAQLRQASVAKVHVVARRGPVQAACTPKELKELLGLPEVAVCAEPSQLAVSPDDQVEMKSVRMKRRIFELMSSAAQQPKPEASKQLHLQFYRSPAAVVQDDEGRVKALRVEKTQLKVEAGKPATAVGTGEMEEIPCQMVLVSIGYRSKALEGLPFDARSGTVPHQAGRVLAEGGAPELGLYCCGWLKRGPSGIIGTNLEDAEDTVASMVQDSERLVSAGYKDGFDGLLALLKQRNTRYVTYDGWKRIDAAEVERGQAGGKLREKMVDVEEMLEIGQAAA